MTTNRLRTLAQFSSGTDLVVRMQEAEQVIVWQREGLTWAADEIDRLTAELKAARAAAPPCSVDTDGPDSGATRAP